MKPWAGGVILAAVLTAGACSSASRATHRASTTARQNNPTTTSVARRSSGCRGPATFTRGISKHTIRSGGRTRVYEVDVPPSYNGSTAYALLFGLHALTVDYRFVPAMTGFAQGDRYHFIGVNPSGLVTGATPYWDAAPTAQNYDVTFLLQLLDTLEAHLCIDPARVFSVGMSNGAQMSSLLACRLTTRVTAIGAVSGVEFPEPCRGQPVPVMAFHGTADPVLPYSGGGLNATKIAATYYYRGHPPAGLPPPLGVDESMRRWAAHNGCSARPVEKLITPHVTRRTWLHSAAATVLYIVRGGGHQWPGQPQPAFDNLFGPGTKEIDATSLMFHFFFDSTR